MPKVESRHRRIHKSTSEIAQSRYTYKLIWNEVVKKLRFETLKNLNIPKVTREIIPDTVKYVCLKILVLHLFGIIVGESEMDSAPWKFSIFLFSFLSTNDVMFTLFSICLKVLVEQHLIKLPINPIYVFKAFFVKRCYFSRSPSLCARLYLISTYTHCKENLNILLICFCFRFFLCFVLVFLFVCWFVCFNFPATWWQWTRFNFAYM